MKKRILLVLVAAIIFSACAFSLFGCSTVSTTPATTASSASLGGMDVWVFVPDAALGKASKNISKDTPKVSPPSGYVALSGAT